MTACSNNECLNWKKVATEKCIRIIQMVVYTYIHTALCTEMQQSQQTQASKADCPSFKSAKLFYLFNFTISDAVFIYVYVYVHIHVKNCCFLLQKSFTTLMMSTLFFFLKQRHF